MEDSEVVVKGELHSSRGDHDREREILVEGVDYLVLEGADGAAEYSLFQQWYAFAMLITEYLFFRILYTDSSVLVDIAHAQGAEVTWTRESDASVLENSHLLVQVGAAILFFTMFFAAALFGIAGIHRMGVPLLIGSVMLPILLLRIHESTWSSGSRNKKMAEKISEAAEEGGKVLAVVGGRHADKVCEHLPDEINLVREKPEYPCYSRQHLKDIAYPSFVLISVLWVFYTIFVAYAEFAWALS